MRVSLFILREFRVNKRCGLLDSSLPIFLFRLQVGFCVKLRIHIPSLFGATVSIEGRPFLRFYVSKFHRYH